VVAQLTQALTASLNLDVVLQRVTEAARPFTAREEDVLRRLPDLAATAIHNAQL
jgi:hypothetical protein